VGKYTKHCQRYSKALTKEIGEMNIDFKILPAATQILFYALFAYWITDLSTTTLVGDTSKAVIIPEKASAARIFALFCCFRGASVIINSKLII
jgi:hypothetical protein